MVVEVGKAQGLWGSIATLFAKVDGEAKHPEIDMDCSGEGRPLQVQRGSDLDVDVDGAYPQVQRETDADAQPALSLEPEGLVVDQHVGKGIEPRVERTERQRRIKPAAGHAKVGCDGKVGFSRDGEGRVKRPADG